MTGIQTLLVMGCMVKPARGIGAEIAAVLAEKFWCCALRWRRL
jgi:hypothetical protein